MLFDYTQYKSIINIILVIIFSYLLFKFIISCESFADIENDSLSPSSSNDAMIPKREINDSKDTTISPQKDVSGEEKLDVIQEIEKKRQDELDEILKEQTQISPSSTPINITPPIKSNPLYPVEEIKESEILRIKQLCIGNTCLKEEDVKKIVKHGDSITIKSNMNNSRLRIENPTKNKPSEVTFHDSNRGPWNSMQIEKCGMMADSDLSRCWNWSEGGRREVVKDE